ATTTVRWSDTYLSRPEQALVGGAYVSTLNSNVPYVVTNSSNWVYAGTGFIDGNSVPGIVGYEVDRYFELYPLPDSVVGTYTILSNSPFSGDHASSFVYQAQSGAWVFNAGTISWAWALDKAGLVDTRIQQTTAN